MRKTVSIAGGLILGDGGFAVMAGPCAVENRDQILQTAREVAAAGACMLRGGAFKPRTSPASFQGLGGRGLELLAEAANATGLPVVTEVLDLRDIERVAGVASLLQVGSRNMQNFPLLAELGRQPKPVLLKRGAAATLDELLAAADYIVRGGNDDIVLCERGVRGFDPTTRYVLDLAAVPALQQRSPFPVIVDPSHGTGRRELVPPMCRAALAAGADGLLLEVHPRPAKALCDGPQALRPHEFGAVMTELGSIARACGRRLLRPVRGQAHVEAEAR